MHDINYTCYLKRLCCHAIRGVILVLIVWGTMYLTNRRCTYLICYGDKIASLIRFG